MHDDETADPGRLAFGATVDSALAAYLERVGSVAGLSASDLLTGLAFAEAPGLPAGLWQLAVQALHGARVPVTELTRFARSSAANFLVESGTGSSGQPTGFRLFHQALNDALMRLRARAAARADDERALTSAFIGQGKASGWQGVPEYLLRSLPGHAAAGGLIDDLLADDDYLLHADLRRLLLFAGHPASERAWHALRLLGLTSHAASASSGDRAVMFSVTLALSQMPPSYLGDPHAPYLARWARTQLRGARAVLEGHRATVTGVCAVEVAGRQLVASAGADRTVRLWDPASGEQRAVLEGHQGGVWGVCAVEVAGRQLVASASADRTVRVWDPSAVTAVLTIPVHHDALAVAVADGALAIGLSAGVLAIDLRPSAIPG
jgi:hypothetical protein